MRVILIKNGYRVPESVGFFSLNQIKVRYVLRFKNNAMPIKGSSFNALGRPPMTNSREKK